MLISNTEETAYLDKTQELSLCQVNNLDLNIYKTKEMIMKQERK